MIAAVGLGLLLAAGLAAAEQPRLAIRPQPAGAAPGALLSRQVGRPLLGLAPDAPAGALRLIWGIPGSAVIGDSIFTVAPLALPAISPQQDFVLALDTGSGDVVLVRNLAGTAAIRRVPEALSVPDQIVLSSRGRTAAVYSSDRRRLQFLTGLPAAPTVDWEIDLPGRPTPSALAVSDDGRTAVLGFAGGGIGWVTVLAEATERFSFAAGQPSAAAFLHRRPDAVLTDRLYKRVYLIEDAAGAARVRTLADERDGISDPIAVAISGDDSRVFVANAATGTIAIIDLRGGPPTAIPCGCVPAGLHRLRGNEVFRLTDPVPGPLWVLDAGAAAPRIVSVPRERGEKP